MDPFNLTTAGGFIDYTVVALDRDDVGVLSKWCQEGLSSLYRSLFKTSHPRDAQPKRSAPVLFPRPRQKTYPSQTISLKPFVKCMLVRKSSSHKRVVRGAVTNGHDWIFLIVKSDADGNGVMYGESDVVRLIYPVPPGVEEVSKTMCAAIAGIITYWVEHSNEDIEDDDWFAVKWDPTPA